MKTFQSLNNTIYKITHWETWDWRIKYIPIVPVWAWNCIRAGSFWFFTPSNPKLAFGGFEGETKMSIYKHLPPGSFPKSIGITAEMPFSELEKSIAADFSYPFVVKPEVGRMGFLFRIIKTPAELRSYHEMMPVDYLLQELVTYPLEVSVFYYRFPNAKTGTITGFIRKEFLEVKGDGKSTLEELMTDYSRIRFRLDEMRTKHAENLQLVLKKDEIFCLSHALNLSRGCKLVSLEHEKDERLIKVFDEISSYSDTLFYGRYDIKCSSIEELKEGKNFSILEYNGCGGEPHHVYGNGNTLFQACKILAGHWNILYQISRYNHSKGIDYWSFKRGWNAMSACRKHFALLKKIDAVFSAS
ncbi:hypothetical protein [Chryseobacterium sp.]|uniref:hypothetical protein n=1 Tax=Chryseobacterium sp. TaxID=1871047 RepID=UPI0011CAD408|nr:hypothetical protein [Chryseobacterium sp.]TXF74879.1 hypothetical protein FUA25_11350 [Chryseobacterium sp.]